jgi:hypothetical protein
MIAEALVDQSSLTDICTGLVIVDDQSHIIWLAHKYFIAECHTASQIILCRLHYTGIFLEQVTIIISRCSGWHSIDLPSISFIWCLQAGT